MRAGARAVPTEPRRPRRPEVVTFAFAPVEEDAIDERTSRRSSASGCTPSAGSRASRRMDMGADAIRLALADAGISWAAGPARVRRQPTRSSNPDAVVGRLGLTGIPFRGVFNGCATASTAMHAGGRARSQHGEADLAIAIGFDKHPRGAFAADPPWPGIPAWYGADRAVPHHALLRHEDQPLHGTSTASPHETLARVAAKNFRNGAEQREGLAAHAADRGGDPRLAPYLNYPLTQFMYCGPNEGAAAVVLCRGRPGPQVHRPRPCASAATAAAHPPARRLRGAEPVAARRRPCAEPDRVRLRGRVREGRASAPRTSHVAQLQDTDAGSEIIHMAENGFCKRRRAGAASSPRVPPRSAAGCRSTPTAGCIGQRRADRRLRAAPDPRDRPPAARYARARARSPARRASATPTCTARPARRR